jgi:hypothetical protein
MERKVCAKKLVEKHRCPWQLSADRRKNSARMTDYEIGCDCGGRELSDTLNAPVPPARSEAVRPARSRVALTATETTREKIPKPLFVYPGNG